MGVGPAGSVFNPGATQSLSLLSPRSHSLSALFAAMVSGSADASRINNQKKSMQTGKVEMAGDPH